MTVKECIKKIDYFIEEAEHLRGNVITCDVIYFDTPIEDDRLEPFWNNLFDFIKSITDNVDYINSYINDKGCYEYNVGQSQKKLMELKEVIALHNKLTLKIKYN